MLLEALNNSLTWILKSQKEDGGFPFPSAEGSSACWLTSEALAALCRGGMDLNDARFKKGVAWLLNHQNDDGGWPALLLGSSTTESTAWGLLALVLAKADLKSVKKALNCLINLQDSSGGWPRSKGGKPTATMTAMAIMALEEIIGSDPNEKSLKQGYEWLESTQLIDGGWLTLNSLYSDAAPVSYLLFASHKTKNNIGKQLYKSSLNWIEKSGLPQNEWPLVKKWCTYETYHEGTNEWPRRKYFAMPFAIAGAYAAGFSISNIDKIVNLLLLCQTPSGQWILQSESGEEYYTWYTYVTTFALSSMPTAKIKELDNFLEKSLRKKAATNKIYAITIGINNYNEKVVSPLKCAENDEKAISTWLQKGPSKSRLKLYRLTAGKYGKKPTRSNILGTLGKVLQHISDNSESTFIFFFSGHGRRFGSKDYLLPIDFTVDAPEETAITLDDLISKTRAVQPGRAIFLIDACRDETSKGLGEWFQHILMPKYLAFQSCIATVLSCGHGEISFELPRANFRGIKGLGAFTLAFLKSVKNSLPKDGEKSLKVILEQVPQELEKLNRKYGKGIQHLQINAENISMLEDTFLPPLE